MSKKKDLLKILRKYRKSVKDINEYFADVHEKKACPSGEIYDENDVFWAFTGNKDGITWRENKEDDKEGDEFDYSEEILGTCLWETKDFTMATFIDSCGHGEYTMIFDNSKKVNTEEMDEDY
jgi:hypothetical protein